MTGNGKIARTPRAIRDGLNRRMDDGQTGKKLLAEQFPGHPVSKQNPSEWKAGLPRRSLLAKAGLPRRSLLAKAVLPGRSLWLAGRETRAHLDTAPVRSSAFRRLGPFTAFCRVNAGLRTKHLFTFGGSVEMRPETLTPPPDDGDFRPALNHQNYQTNPNANLDFTQ